MELSNCRGCGKLILTQSSRFCEVCNKAQMDEFQKIKEYLREHPKAMLMEIHEATGVSLKAIKELIMEEKIGYG